MTVQEQGTLNNTQQQRSSTQELIQNVQKEVKPFRMFLTKFTNDWSTTFAGVLAYNILTAMLPIAIALVSILGFVLGNTNRDAIIRQVNAVFPAQAGQQNAVALAIDQLSKQAGILAVIAVVLAIFGGSRLFINLESCLSIVYRVRPRTFIPQNLMALGMLVLFIILVPLMVFSATIPEFVLNFMANNPLLANISFVKSVVSSPVITYVAALFGGLVSAFLLFEAIYVVVPNLRITWRRSWVGALVAALAMVIFLNLFPLYIHYFMKSYAGAIGFAVILLLFFYYFAVILMLGAEVNAFFRAHVQPMPNDLATFVSTMAGKLNQDIPPGEGESHRNPEATEHADRAHLARTRHSEEEIHEKNMRKQQQLVAADTKRQDKGKARQSSRLTTLLSVTIGSVVTIIAELWRSRQKAR